MADFKAIINKANLFLNNLPQIIKNSPRDEQYAYYVVFAGFGLMFIGMVLVILL